MKPRFDELLPFYANGTLSPVDREWVESYLREHPSARAELQWYESLQTQLREDVPAVSSEVGLERAMRRIRDENPASKSTERAVGSGTLQRVRTWLGSLVPQPVLKPAFGVALALVVIQAGVIATLMSGHDQDSEIRSIRGSVVEKGPYLKVNFKADAREADIRMLLVEVHGSLAAGPGQLGDYYVRVPQEDKLAGVSEALAASKIVDSVAVVDALPPRP
jgi:hypothetical protein